MNQLKAAIENESNEKIIKLCKKLDGSNVKRCLAIAYIKQEHYTKVLEIDDDLMFEKAYALYRLNRLDESLALIQVIDQQVDHILHLKAQVLYRLERFEEAIEIYNALNGQDVVTNKFACITSLLMCRGSNYGEFEPETWEQMYNCACFYYLEGKLPEALEIVENAIGLFVLIVDLCRSTLLNEGYELHEVEEELSSPMLLKSIIQLHSGSIETATNNLNSLVKSSDKLVSALAHLNLMSVTPRLIAQKHFRQINSKILEKMNSHHRKILDINRFLLQFKLHKSSIAEKFPNEDAILLCNPNLHQSSFRELHKESLSIQLVHISELLLQADYKQAEKETYSLIQSNEKARPGLISLLLWIYDKTNQSEKGLKLIEDYRTSAKSVAEFKLDLGYFKEAVLDLKAIVEKNPKDFESIAKLAMAFTKVDLEKAKEYQSKLSISKNEFDIEELMVLKQKPLEETKIKRKRRRSKPIPKNFDPEKTPDPNRWLPKARKLDIKSKKGNQGVAIEGGGIGGTGSAKIAGLTKKAEAIKEEKVAEPQKKTKKKK